MFDGIIMDIMILVKPITEYSKTRVKLCFTVITSQATEIVSDTQRDDRITYKAVQRIVISFYAADACP